jgi:hypothetical protein
MINKALFGLKPFEILEAIRKEIEKLPISEELKEIEIENVRKLLAYGPFLKPGVGFSAYPMGFFEELFWVALLEGEKIFLVKVEWEPEGKSFFWVKKETEATFKEEPIPLKELLKEFENKRLATIAIQFLKETLIKEAFSVDWDEEELLLAEELIESGTYLFKTSHEGISFKKLGWHRFS